MENENIRTSAKSHADLISAFASSFEKNVKEAEGLPEEDETEPQENFMVIGSRENESDDLAVLADMVDEMQEEKAKSAVPAPSAPVYEPEAQPEPTAKQLRKAERQAKKDARWEKKQAKRNAKIDRQQRNNTKVMLGGAIFLGLICLVLVFMNHFELTFVDIPDVLSGEKSLSTVTTTMPLAINEPSESGPTAPPKGNYTVTVADGVYLRDSANDSASRVAVLEEGTKIAVSAFKYDKENEVFWGRAGINGIYGWVKMTNLTFDSAPTPTEKTTVESLG